MALRYTIEEVSKNGAVDTRSDDYSQAEVIIGRGSGADVKLNSSFVSLRHARVIAAGEVLTIEDLGSLSGVKVNDRIVTRQQLSSGDIVKIGDVRITVSRKGADWVLSERRVESRVADVETTVKEKMHRLNVVNRLPSYTLLSLLLGTAVMVGSFLLPFARDRKDLWNSGPISNMHRAFAGNCETCHVTPFIPVKDDQCLSCHKMSEHSPLLKAHQGLEKQCSSCHIEHEGDKGLVLRKNETCAECHSNIKSRAPNATTANVTGFSSHPEFAVAIAPAIPGTGKVERVRLNDTAKLIDNSNVKLNHELHLKGPLRNRTGGTQSLACDSCHQFSPDRKNLKPITFENHCQSCHGIGFDERLPELEVPHGTSPDQTYTFLYAEYAKLLLSKKDDAHAQEAFRLRPGDRGADSAAAEEFNKTFVEQESRNAEQQLFEKTACQLCHQVRPRTDVSEADVVAKGLSRYTVLTPQVPSDWMTKAVFTHGAHDAVQCDSCHSGVRRSKETKDVLMPKAGVCQNCHADPGDSHKVSSDCTMCHSYHDKLPLEAGRQQRIHDLLRTEDKL